MSNKALITPQLDKLEKHHEKRLHDSISDRMIGLHFGYLSAINIFRLMLEGVDVTVGLEVDKDG